MDTTDVKNSYPHKLLAGVAASLPLDQSHRCRLVLWGGAAQPKQTSLVGCRKRARSPSVTVKM